MDGAGYYRSLAARRIASWDRPFFYINNVNAYPSTYGPVDSVNINAGWSVDYASSDPSFIVGLIDYGVAVYSTDGGQTWENFASEPTFPARPMEEPSPPARQKTSLLRRQMAFNPIIPSTAARPGTPLLCRA